MKLNPPVNSPAPQALQLFGSKEQGDIIAVADNHLLMDQSRVLAVFYDGGLGTNHIFHNCNFVLN